MTGLVSYHSGLAAEDIVARHYSANGFTSEVRRWRGQGGEIDLVMSDLHTAVFVEVKKSKSHFAAAHRVSRRQLHRIFCAAEEYLGSLHNKAQLEARVDIALVDETGRLDIIENVFPD